MTSNQERNLSVEHLPLQEGSALIARDKRLLPGEELDDMRHRLAKALARPEKDPEKWEDQFYWALGYAFPGGRISANLGAEEFKANTSTINCTVSATIPDSMDGILAAAHEAGLTLKAGCGIGYDFTTIRPKNAQVSGVGAQTSGSLPFMDIFDAICKTVASAGGRRGAQMGVMDIQHPDVLDFIKAKREPGRFSAFNLSVLVTDAFIAAKENDEEWPLVFPAFPSEMDGELVWRSWPYHESCYTINENNEVACRVYNKIRARELWDLIMKSTYDFSDPGFLLIDQINRMNPLWFAEDIRATNPCGEQPLPPYGACLLGSVNLASLVRNPFTPAAYFDWDCYGDVIRIFSRMLDNVVEMNGLPLERQREEIRRKRRHGMGFLGLGSAMNMLGITYGSSESVQFTDEISRILALESWRAGVELADEKGAAPILDEDFEITREMLNRNARLKTDGYKVGDKVKGRVLHAKYSEYMSRIETEDPLLIEKMAQIGCRYTHCTSIAPTGTMAAGEGNNASNGIEPSFSHTYIRNMIVPGRNTKISLRMYSYELLAYKTYINPDVDPENLPKLFQKSTADQVSPKGHIDVQAAAQKWIDSAISKTTNVPTDILYSDFEDIYVYGVNSGLKGCTTFRFNPIVHQGVLVKENDLNNTTYHFKLEDGRTISAKGSDIIVYNNEKQTAANLFDAFQTGRYGRY